MRKKGSYTIEAALLMPLIIGVMIFIIYLAYYTHDRAILQKSAYIAALRGSQIRTGDQEAFAVASENADLLIQDHLLGSWTIQKQVLLDTDTVTVIYTGSMKIPGGILLDRILKRDIWQVSKNAYAYRIDEPAFIRTIRK